jgi:hypothetical protein
MLDILAMCIVDQENVLVDKKPLDIEDHKTKVEFLERFEFIVDQISEFLDDRTNFLS